MADYKIEQLVKNCGGRLVAGTPEAPVSRLAVDPFNIIFPGESLFFAIKRHGHDSHGVIAELYENGVINFVVNRITPVMEGCNRANFVVVEDVQMMLFKISEFHRKQFSCHVIALTGGIGKTEIKEWISSISEPAIKVVKTSRSMGSETGVPLSVWSMGSDAGMCVFEASAVGYGTMEHLEKVISPQTGVITGTELILNDGFSSLKEKATEELKLFRNCKSVIYCSDKEYLHEAVMESELHPKVKLFTWSFRKPADINVQQVKKRDGKTMITVLYNMKEITVTIPFTDDEPVENAIYTLAVSLFLNYGEDIIIRRMKRLNKVSPAMEQHEGINNCTVIYDRYCPDIASIPAALGFLVDQKKYNKRTVIICCPEQFPELGEKWLSDFASMIEAIGVRRLITAGLPLSSAGKYFRGNNEHYSSAPELERNIDAGKFNNEAILIFGFPDSASELILPHLQHKLHNAVLEVDLDSMANNIDYFRNQLDSQTKLIAVVKAFSYGSGSYDIPCSLQNYPVDYLAVAVTDEGVALRNSGVELPVLVMNPDPYSYSRMIDNRLQPEIYSFTSFSLLNDELEKKGVDEYPVHIKFDTGMHRLGFLSEEIDMLAERCREFRRIRVESVFSHLSAADDSRHDEFTNEQLRKFIDMSRRFEEKIGHKVLRHILNSPGIERFPGSGFNMVRLGIGMYGVSALKNKSLENVCTLKSKILQVKELQPGVSVGYLRKHMVKETLKVAVVAAGYADGFNRKLGNGNWSVFVKGKQVAVIGNVCMDMFMIDITGIDASEGDEVILFGERNNICTMAEVLGTIPNEILTSVSARVRRVYIRH